MQPAASGVDVARHVPALLCADLVHLLAKPCRGAWMAAAPKRALKPVSCRRLGRMIHEQATGQPDLNSHDIAQCAYLGTL
jgi:hypothetical protein